jgi:60 kDa SS-A/Ro ribonucleoprotein
MSENKRTNELRETENLEVPSPEIELISLLVSSSFKDDYFRTMVAPAARMSTLVRTVEPEYAARAALLARRFEIRNPVFLVAGELSQVINGQPWAANFYRRLPRNPIDVLAVIVYIRARYKKIPSRVKRGLGAYLRSLSEASLAHYAGEKHFSLKLVDAVNLLHPKHSDPLGKLVRGSLLTPSPNGTNGSNGSPPPIIRQSPLALMRAAQEIDLMA